MFVPATEFLIWAFIVELAVYLTSSVVLIATRVRHERRIGLLGRLEMLLDCRSPGSMSASEADRRLAIDMTARAPLADIRILASDGHLSRPVMTVLAQSLLVRLGAARVHEDARSCRSRGRSWRQIVALRTLAFADRDQVWVY